MHTVTINLEILAQRLEHAAERYDEDAVKMREANQPGLRRTLERQAHEAREWAEAFRNIRAIGFEGDDIEVEVIPRLAHLGPL